MYFLTRHRLLYLDQRFWENLMTKQCFISFFVWKALTFLFVDFSICTSSLLSHYFLLILVIPLPLDNVGVGIVF